MAQIQKGFRKGGAVAIGVAGDAVDYVDSFRRRYDPHVARIMPHITLAFARELESARWYLARPCIARDLAEISPFTIRVAETGSFAREGFVLWLKPAVEHDELALLRHIVLKAFPGVAFERVDDFVPHISIGFFETEEDLEEAETIVQHELHSFSFRVASVSFLQADEGNIWQCIDSIELGGPEDRPPCG